MCILYVESGGKCSRTFFDGDFSRQIIVMRFDRLAATVDFFSIIFSGRSIERHVMQESPGNFIIAKVHCDNEGETDR